VKRAVLLGALLTSAGCPLLEDAPAGRGVNITVSSKKISVSQRAALARLSLEVLGDEHLTQPLDPSTFFKSGEGRVHYSAGAAAKKLRFRVDARDADDVIVSRGASGEVTLGAGAQSVHIELGPAPSAAGAACTHDDECGSEGGCVDSVCCKVSACSACMNCSAGTGTCDTVVKNAPDPTPTDCAAPGMCDDSGVCKRAPGAAGAPCSNGGECSSTFCADGVCCEQACDQPCQRCGSNGKCEAVTNAPDADTCAMGAGGANVCDATARCIHPHLVSDLESGAGSSLPAGFLEGPNGQIYFSAATSPSGRELWVSDGSSTRMIELQPGAAGGNPSQLTRLGNRVYFAVNNENTRQLGSSDGMTFAITNSGFPGTTLANVGELAATSSVVLFAASGNTAQMGVGNELWAKGPTGGVMLVKDILTGDSSPHAFTSAAGKLFFAAKTPPSGTGVAVNELWVSDGTTGGTVQLSHGSLGEGDITALGSTVYFSYTNSDELWKSDGTPSSTTVVSQNVHAGRGLAMFKNRLYLSTRDDVFVNAFARVGDTNDPSAIVPLLSYIGNSQPESTVLDDALLFFRAQPQSASGHNLYVYDGNDANTVKEITADGLPSGRNPRGLIAYRHWVFFAADPGGELWMTNGSVTARACQGDTGCFLNAERPRIALDRLWFGADIAPSSSATRVGFEPFVFP
jgi:ELWxxDGT repeat protein